MVDIVYVTQIISYKSKFTVDLIYLLLPCIVSLALFNRGLKIDKKIIDQCVVQSSSMIESSEKLTVLFYIFIHFSVSFLYFFITLHPLSLFSFERNSTVQFFISITKYIK